MGVTCLQVSGSYLIYLPDVRDTAKSGMGRTGNRHLHYLAESISVNVGGSRQNGKGSSLPRSVESVGGVIVLGARENCVRGEGRQEFNMFLVESTRSWGKSPAYSALAVMKSKSNETDDRGGNSL